VRDRFGIFGTVTIFRELSLLLVMMLRIPNNNSGDNEKRHVTYSEGLCGCLIDVYHQEFADVIST